MKRDILPGIIAIVVFLLVFNAFYIVAPVPFEIAKIDEVYHFAPKGYVHSADRPDKVIAWPSAWKGYKVVEYWYHWPYDGYEAKDDWEPVILLIDQSSVKAVAVRVHYAWRVAYAFPKEGDKPVVSFLALWHTPLLREPSDGVWVEVDKKPVVEKPPEDVDYAKVFGIAFSPTESALASAFTFGILAGATSYLLVGLLTKRF